MGRGLSRWRSAAQAIRVIWAAASAHHQGLVRSIILYWYWSEAQSSRCRDICRDKIDGTHRLNWSVTVTTLTAQTDHNQASPAPQQWIDCWVSHWIFEVWSLKFRGWTSILQMCRFGTYLCEGRKKKKILCDVKINMTGLLFWNDQSVKPMFSALVDWLDRWSRFRSSVTVTSSVVSSTSRGEEVSQHMFKTNNDNKWSPV